MVEQGKRKILSINFCHSYVMFFDVQYSSNLLITTSIFLASWLLRPKVLKTSTASSPAMVNSVEHCTCERFLSIPVALR